MSKFIVIFILFGYLLGCDKSNSVITNQKDTFKKLNPTECVQVYFDEKTPSDELISSEQDSLGRVYANMTLNLLAHFSKYSRLISPISFYQKGDIEKCDVTLYLGSDYYTDVPIDFIEDFKSTKKRVAWLGYSFWDLGDELKNIFGVQFDSFTELNKELLTNDQKPSFFRDVIYKGEVFQKYNEWSRLNSTEFIAAYEVSKLKVIDSSKSQVLAEISHSATGEKIPWALQAGSKFIITEIPFSYIHESDRYLVFADLLFDILNEKPLRDEHLAVIRLEDIHPFVDIVTLRESVQILKEENIVPHLSVIPSFKDPLAAFMQTPVLEPIAFYEVADFHQLIQKFSAEGAVLIWHGVTHQYNEVANPFSGTTADDYEFWDAQTNQPIREDSESYVLNRLNLGANIFKMGGLSVPQIWLTPHYKASALDHLVFAQYFSWTMGRMTYFNFDRRSPSQTALRSAGQFFPYEIYNDIYGQRVIPENLGNVQNELNDQVVQTRTVEQILEDARRNLVLRDSWASVFFHPFLLKDQDPVHNDLRKLVTGLKRLGYKFTHLNDFVQKNNSTQSEIIDQQNFLNK